jgi:hypothetical protein
LSRPQAKDVDDDEHPLRRYAPPHEQAGGLSVMASPVSTETELKYDTDHTARVPVFRDISGVD